MGFSPSLSLSPRPQRERLGRSSTKPILTYPSFGSADAQNTTTLVGLSDRRACRGGRQGPNRTAIQRAMHEQPSTPHSASRRLAASNLVYCMCVGENRRESIMSLAEGKGGGRPFSRLHFYRPLVCPKYLGHASPVQRRDGR